VVFIRSASTGKTLQTFQEAEPGITVQTVRYGAGDTFLISGLSNGKVILHDLRNGMTKTIEGKGQAISSAEVSPDGRFALIATEEGSFDVWDLGAEKYLWQFYLLGKKSVRATFSPDGTKYAVMQETSIAIRHTESGAWLANLPGRHDPKYRSFAFSQDGKMIYVGDAHSKINQWKEK
jgi:WD40 repeat protein